MTWMLAMVGILFALGCWWAFLDTRGESTMEAIVIAGVFLLMVFDGWRIRRALKRERHGRLVGRLSR